MTTTHEAPNSIPDTTADRELKAKHRGMWGLGDYAPWPAR